MDNEQKNYSSEDTVARLAALEARVSRAGRALKFALLGGLLGGFLLSSANLAAQEDWAPSGFHVFTAGAPAKASEVNDNFKWLVQRLEATTASANMSAPPGTVVAFAGQEVPPGWLLCDGSVQATITFPELAAVLGDAWAPSTASTFTLPDLRGQFLRGLDSGAGIDPEEERKLGSIQNHAMQRIQGTVHRLALDTTVNPTGAFSYQDNKPLHGGTNANGDRHTTLNFDSGKVTNTAPETRPTNAAVHFIIKY